MLKQTDLATRQARALGRCLVYICDVLAARGKAHEGEVSDEVGAASPLSTMARQSERKNDGKTPDHLSRTPQTTSQVIDSEN